MIKFNKDKILIVTMLFALYVASALLSFLAIFASASALTNVPDYVSVFFLISALLTIPILVFSYHVVSRWGLVKTLLGGASPLIIYLVVVFFLVTTDSMKVKFADLVEFTFLSDEPYYGESGGLSGILFRYKLVSPVVAVKIQMNSDYWVMGQPTCYVDKEGVGYNSTEFETLSTRLVENKTGVTIDLIRRSSSSSDFEIANIKPGVEYQLEAVQTVGNCSDVDVVKYGYDSKRKLRVGAFVEHASDKLNERFYISSSDITVNMYDFNEMYKNLGCVSVKMCKH